MLGALALLALTASPPQGLKVAFPGLTGAGTPAQKLAYFTDHLDQQMTFAGADTITSREIAALLGIERQRQLLGCADESSSCLAELAGALAADAMLQGDITVLGGEIAINLKLLKPTDGSTLSAWSDRVSTDAAAADSLAQGARVLVSQAAQALGRAVTPKAVTRVSPLRRWSVLPLVLGVAACATGAGLLVKARLDFDALAPAMPIPSSRGAALAAEGERFQLIGWIATGAGLALAATGAAMFVLGRDQTISTAVAPVPGGASMSLWGTW
jgi:hypothetical protein